MQDYYQEDVPDWFGRSSLSRMMERRTQGITADWLLGELVRTPGQVNSATSSTGREPQDMDPQPPGQTEWHGAIHRIVPGAGRLNIEPGYQDDERHAEFTLALRSQGVDRSFFEEGIGDDEAGLRLDNFLGFADRRRFGRRHRKSDWAEMTEGPQEPYPHPGPVDESRYERF
jgi:hypothetical protein